MEDNQCVQISVTEELLKIEKETGLTCIQKNKQRIFCPNHTAVEYWPQGAEIYVNHFPPHKIESLLFCLFKECGRILQTRLMIKESGENKGFAFVLFETVEEADRAVKTVHNKEIRCFNYLYCLSVTKSEDNRRLFVGGLSKELTKQQIFEVVNRFARGLNDVLFFNDLQINTRNRGFCFLDFNTHKHAIKAKGLLSNVLPVMWKPNKVVVNWAVPEPKANREAMEKVRKIFIRGLKLETTALKIRKKVFNMVGIYIPHENVKKTRDYAFVKFDERKTAVLAVDKLNRSIIDGAEIQVQLARPPNEICWINEVMQKSDTPRKAPLGPKSFQRNIAETQCTGNNLNKCEPQELQQMYQPQTEVYPGFEYELQSSKKLELESGTLETSYLLHNDAEWTTGQDLHITPLTFSYEQELQNRTHALTQVTEVPKET